MREDQKELGISHFKIDLMQCCFQNKYIFFPIIIYFYDLNCFVWEIVPVSSIYWSRDECYQHVTWSPMTVALPLYKTFLSLHVRLLNQAIGEQRKQLGHRQRCVSHQGETLCATMWISISFAKNKQQRSAGEAVVRSTNPAKTSCHPIIKHMLDRWWWRPTCQHTESVR